jgi:hypothetical protein
MKKPPPWFKLVASHSIEAIREVAVWWYRREMAALRNGVSADRFKVLSWYDEISFSNQNRFATDSEALKRYRAGGLQSDQL